MFTAEVRESFRAHDLYWAAKLITELDLKHQGNAVNWAIECIRALAKKTASTTQAQLEVWLDELSRLSKNDVIDRSVLIEASQRIWHQERDMFHTSVAHLYAAVVYLSEQNFPMYRRSLITAMDVVGRHEYYRQTSIAIPLSLFEQYRSDW